MSDVVSDRPGEAWRRGLGGILDYAAASNRRAIWILLAFALIAFLPGYSKVPPIDRDEARFAQATKQMVASGEYVDIRFQNDVRYQKPIGIYWLQAAALTIADAVSTRDMQTRIYVYRIPSLIGAVGAVIATFWIALAFASRRVAILAAVMMASSILLGLEARLATTDAMLLLTTLLCLGVLARAYLNPPGEWEADRWRLPITFWVALAAGVLLKGPLILLFVGLPIVTLAIIDRSAGWVTRLRPLIGIPLFLLLVLPWFIAIVGRSGGAFLYDSVGGDLLAKVVSGQESHGAPPGYFIVLFFITFWPASILAGMAVPWVWREKWEAPIKFLLAWLVPAWILFELIITKLPHYVLPLYPALAILLAMAIDRQTLSRQKWMEYGTFWWFAVPVFFFIGSLVLLLRYEGNLGWPAWPFLGAAMVFGFRAWWLYFVDGPERSMLRAAVTSVLLAIAVYWSVLPSLAILFPSVAIARAVRTAECPDPKVAAAGYQEPSLVFLAGTDTLLTSAGGAADFLQGDKCRFAVIEASLDRTFARRAEAIGLRYTKASQFTGYNLGSGGRVSLTIYKSLGDL
jgi:4-amino-4-deoxy-L-arabinose transferase-like glycosyltransferase